jgi:hypothetical protein
MERSIPLAFPTLDPNDYDAVLARLGAVDDRGKYAMAICPAHADQNPSLKVSKGTTGKVLLKCFAGCSRVEILDALEHTEPVAEIRRLVTQDLDLAHPDEVYPYHDADGALVFEVCLYSKDKDGNPLKHGKSFRQRRYVKGKHTPRYALDGVDPVLYRLPEVLEGIAQGRTVFVVEGEKDAETLRSRGYVATTNPMGRGKWKDSYSEVLRGADVVVIADNDEDGGGQEHARTVAQALGAEVMRTPEGKDVSEYLTLDETHSVDDLIPLDEAAQETEEQEPQWARIAPIDLRPALRDGVPEIEILSSTMQRTQAHQVYGAMGIGKSFAELAQAAALLRDGHAVAWFDEENGERVTVERLRALGATEDEVSRFLYFPYTAPTPADVPGIVAMFEQLGVVHAWIDTAPALTAGVIESENDNLGILGWLRAFLLPFRHAGIGTTTLDHTGRADTHARGASAKRGEFQVTWKASLVEPFGRDEVGIIEYECTKDRNGYWFGKKVRYRLGGTPFVFEEAPVPEDEEDRAARTSRAMRAQAVAALLKHGPMTQSGLEKYVAGQTTEVRKAVQSLPHVEFKVQVRPGRRTGSHVYFHVDNPGEHDEEDD